MLFRLVFVAEVLEHRIEVLVAVVAHGVVIADGPGLEVNGDECPVRVAYVDGRHQESAREDVDLLGPPFDAVVVDLGALDEAFEKERVKEVAVLLVSVRPAEAVVAHLEQ